MSNGVSGGGGIGDVEFGDEGQATGGFEGDDGGGGGAPEDDDPQDAIQEARDEAAREAAGADDDPGTGAPEDDDDDRGGAPVDDDPQDAIQEARDEAAREAAGADDDPGTGAPGEDLTEPVDQELGPSGDETSGFEDPDRVNLDEVRYAAEETEIAGETYQRGEAIPTDRNIARDVEREAVEENPILGREDIAVTRTDEGFEAGVTREGVEQIQRQAEFRRLRARRRARERATSQIEQDLEARLTMQRDIAEARSATIPEPVDVDPGDDFSVERTAGGGFRGQLRDAFRVEFAAEQMEGVDPSDLTVEGGEVRLTEETQLNRSLEEGLRAGDGAGGAVGQRTSTAPERVEAATGPSGLAALGEAVVGPPGTLESEAGYAVSDPVGAVTGAPGSIESGAGDVAFGAREASRTAADTITVEIVEPAAPYVGEAAESIPLGATVLVPSERGGLQNVGTTATAEDIAGQEDDSVIGDDPDTAAGQAAERFSSGAGALLVESTAGAPAGAVDAGDLAARGGEFTAAAIEEEGLVEGGETAAYAGGEFVVEAGGAAVDYAQENPARFAGSLAGGAVGGLAVGTVAGRGLGAAGRAARARARTAGATRVDIEDVTGQSVVRNLEDPAEGDRFPGAADPDLYESDAPAAVRQQAEEMTPTAVQEAFEEAGVTEGATLKKALDVEPEGPQTGRAGSGLRTQAGDYESPGAFVGPELSPNFLRVGERSPGWSWRPGLPDLGESPTGVLIRTDVEAADADDLSGFTEEILEREGGTAARTLPESEVNVGEIEAVIPPEAEFSPLPRGAVSGTARRLGIGSDFYTELPGGTRVPLRTAAPPEEIGGTPSRGLRDLLSDERGQAGAAGSATRTTYRYEELYGPGRPGQDRPLPAVASPTPAASAGSVRAGTSRSTDLSTLRVSDSEVSDEYTANIGDSDYSDVSETERVSATSSVSSATRPSGDSSTAVSEPGGTSAPSDPSTPSETVPSEPTSPSIPSDPGQPSAPGESIPGQPGRPSSPSQPPSRLRPFDDEEEEPEEIFRAEVEQPFTQKFGYGIESEEVIAFGSGLEDYEGAGGDFTDPVDIGDPTVTEVVGDPDT